MNRDLVSISATAVQTADKEVFATDTSISSFSGEIRERPLQKWADDIDASWDNSISNTSQSSSLLATTLLPLSSSSSESHQWDQFEVNEKLFGVKSDFKEELYTTTLDKSGADYKLRELEAIKVAREIERMPSNIIHVMEERGQKVETDGDEEALYSSVARSSPTPSTPLTSNTPTSLNNSPNPGKYIPPAGRAKLQAMAQQQQQQQQTLKQQKSKESTQSVSNQTTDQKEQPTRTAVDVKVEKSETEKLLDKDIAIKPEKTNATPASTRLALPKKDENVAKTADKKSSLLSTFPIIPGNQDISKIKLAKDFKSFANVEKEQLLLRKTFLMKKERDDILEEFKSFSQTFKLSNPPPSDLIPILAKDHKEPVSTKSTPTSNGNSSASTETKSPSPQSPKKAPVQLTQQSKPKETKPAAESHGQPPNGKETTEKEEIIPKEIKKLSTISDDDDVKSVTSTGTSSGKFKFNVSAAEFKPLEGSPSIDPKSPPSEKKQRERGNSAAGYSNNSRQFKQGYQKNSKPSYDENTTPPPIYHAVEHPYGYYPYPGYRGPPVRSFMPGPPPNQVPPGGPIPAFYMPPPPMVPGYPMPPGTFPPPPHHFRPPPHPEGFSPTMSSPPRPYMVTPPMYPGMIPGYPPEMVGYPPHMMMPGPGPHWGPEMQIGELPPPESPHHSPGTPMSQHVAAEIEEVNVAE
ncbi:hypothetical protein HK098_001761 [Nowakowskiella sp. JEL0407]|nr:hypothetical protein HK098_001761 [Nowakowskiella sp. JEL0407]